MPIKKNFLIDLGVLVFLVLIGVAGYWFSPRLLPKSDVVATPEPNCDLHRQACGATLPGGGRIELSITPRPVPMMEPLTVSLQLTGVAARHVAIDFSGLGMSMGYNRPELSPIGSGRFAGRASLPVCITGSMTWQATVLIETDRLRISAPFRFTSLPR